MRGADEAVWGAAHLTLPVAVAPGSSLSPLKGGEAYFRECVIQHGEEWAYFTANMPRAAERQFRSPRGVPAPSLHPARVPAPGLRAGRFPVNRH